MNTAQQARITDFDSDRVAAVALQAFFRIAEAWGLDGEAQRVLLGSPSRRTLSRWRAGEGTQLPRDTVERISVLTGIWKALHILLPVAEQANGWIHRPNTAFGERSALDVMLQGQVDDLYTIRRHLDAWRG